MRKTLLLICLLALPASVTRAADPTTSWLSRQTINGVTISPIFHELSVSDDRPETTAELLAYNHTAIPLLIDVSLAAFSSLGPLGGVDLKIDPPNNPKTALLRRIVVTPDSFTLPPGELQRLQITVARGESLPPGGHYAALILAVHHEGESLTADQLNVNKNLNSLIFLVREGSIQRTLTIKGWQAPTRYWQPPTTAEITFNNGGNVHVRPYGRLDLIDWTGKSVATAILNEQSRLVLPDSDITLAANFNQQQIAWLPGRYTLRLAYRADDGSPAELTQSLIIIPKIGFLPLLALLFVVRFIWKRRRG